MEEHAGGAVDLFLQYVWVPILGVLAYLFKKRDQEIDSMKAQISANKNSIADHRLYAAETFVRQPAVEQVNASIRRLEDKIDDLLKMIANGKSH